MSETAKEVSPKIEQFVDPEQLMRDVRFNEADLSTAMSEHASMYVHYATQSARARAQYETMKTLAEVTESRLDAHHRNLLTADEKKKPTEAAIAAAVKADPRWFAAQRRLIEAREAFDLASDAREAFKQREGMLIQTATDQRREREGEMRMGASKSVAEELRNGVLEMLRTQKEAA